jgi:hypothetical protein
VKILSRRAHGLADYLIVVVLLSVPLSAGLTGRPRALSYSFAVLHLLITVSSYFPPGAIGVISFRVHKIVEGVAGLFLIVSPWLLGFANQPAAVTVFVIIGAAILGMALFTDFDRRRQIVPPPPGERRRWYNRRSR